MTYMFLKRYWKSMEPGDNIIDSTARVLDLNVDDVLISFPIFFEQPPNRRFCLDGLKAIIKKSHFLKGK